MGNLNRTAFYKILARYGYFDTLDCSLMNCSAKTTAKAWKLYLSFSPNFHFGNANFKKITAVLAQKLHLK